MYAVRLTKTKRMWGKRASCILGILKEVHCCSKTGGDLRSVAFGIDKMARSYSTGMNKLQQAPSMRWLFTTTPSEFYVFPIQKITRMLRKQVKALVLDMKKQKKKDYKAILEEIQNEGQEFNAESRTNTATRLVQQAFSLRQPARSRNN